MNGGVSDDVIRFVDGDQQHVRRLVVGHELIPILRREHGLGDELAQVAPARANGGVEDGSDGRSIPGKGLSQRKSRRVRSGLVHETPPNALGSRD
jgi:hypothetical protein